MIYQIVAESASFHKRWEVLQVGKVFINCLVIVIDGRLIIVAHTVAHPPFIINNNYVYYLRTSRGIYEALARAVYKIGDAILFLT